VVFPCAVVAVFDFGPVVLTLVVVELFGAFARAPAVAGRPPPLPPLAYDGAAMLATSRNAAAHVAMRLI
jgi:hypothetical protein